MLNIDDRILDQTTSDELFLMLHISRYMSATDFKAFPSLATLCKKTGFSKPHVLKVKNACIEKGLLSCEKIIHENNAFASNEYTIETEYIGIFINAKGRKFIEETEGGSKQRLQGVVNDVYKGSKQRLQGVVNDVYPNKLGYLPKLVNEQINESAPAQIFSDGLQGEEKKELPPVPPPPPLFQPIRTASELKDALTKMYQTDNMKLQNVKDTFSVYKTSWTKSGMRAALTKFSNWYFSKPDAIPVYDESKADTLFLNALNWLCKEVKDYKDEQSVDTLNKVPQIKDNKPNSEISDELIIRFIQAQSKGAIKINSVQEIKPQTAAFRLYQMGMSSNPMEVKKAVQKYFNETE